VRRRISRMAGRRQDVIGRKKTKEREGRGKGKGENGFTQKSR